MNLSEYSVYELLYIFIIYSFAGWCAEVVYAASIQGKFVNRGFCFGPVCPIYGIGVLSVLLFLEPIKEYWWLLFFESVIFTSFIEFAAGFILEKFFREKWWDYSNEPFNIKGYVCLKFSLLWGIACVLVVNVIHPTVMFLIHIMPMMLGIIILCVLLAIFLTDFGITLITMLKLRKELNSIIEIEDRLRNLSESIGMNLSEKTLNIMEHNEKIKEEFSENENLEKLKETVHDKLSEKKAELDALSEKRRLSIEASRKRMKRIEAAFPNIFKGKYHHIFRK